jgi:hypothetical protein
MQNRWLLAWVLSPPLSPGWFALETLLYWPLIDELASSSADEER